MGNSSELFELLCDLELPVGDYAIFGSGPLIVRGIIHAGNDVDVICRDAAWKRVQELGPLQYLPEHDVDVVTLYEGALSFGTRWAIGEFDVNELIDTAEFIDGMPFVRLEHVIAYKQIAGRPKDIEHLRLVELHREEGGQRY